MAQSCFHVHKKHFRERSTIFRSRFVEKEFGKCLIFGKCKFLYE